MPESSQQILLEKFSELLRSGRMVSTKRALNSLYPAEVASLLESLPIPKRRILWGLLGTELAGDVLLELSDKVREDLIDVTDTDELVTALQGLEIDELADLFDDLPDTVTDSVLDHMAAQDRRRLEQVIAYDEESAGGLMDVNTVTVRPNASLEIVRRYLRMRQSLPEHTHNLFVVDHNNRYLGILPLTKVVTKSGRKTVKDLMETEVTGIPVDTEAPEVVRAFETLDLSSAPVVNADGTLAGRITVDKILDFTRKESWEMEFNTAGLPTDENLFNPAATSALRRGIWLGLNLATAFLAAWVISLFQGTIEKIITLAILIPVVGSMGGIAGSQTLTLIIRGLATDQVGRSNRLLVLAKELSVGILNSLAWGLIVGFLTAYWFGDPFLGLVIAAAMAITLLSAAATGVYVPVLMKKFGIDPALGGGVVLTTITDVVGLLSFLGLASLFLL